MDELKTNVLYFGDNLEILRKYIPDNSIDLLYLEPSPSPYRWLQVFTVMGVVGVAEVLLLWWVRRRS